MPFGRFERTPGHTPMSDINVTPLVDVMMVLLVIFIITAPLMVSSLKLDLPKTDGAHASAPPRAVRLAIDAQAEVYLDDRVITLEALRPVLAQRAERAQQAGAGELPEVQLQADARVPYGKVVEVMGLAQQAGLSRIAFVTERKEAVAKP
jgi:biopolymer transport protein TolR